MPALTRTLDTWRILVAAKSWSGPSRAVLAAQAAILVLCDAEHLAPEVPRAEEQLREGSSLSSGMWSAIGQSMVPLALVHGVSPAIMPAQVKAMRQRFRALGMPWMPGNWTNATAAWLTLLPERQVERALPRMAAIMVRWKQDHPWLTNAGDLHAASLHALGTEDVEQIGLRTEARYQALGGVGFGWNPDRKQRSAQLTALRPELEPGHLVDRIDAIAASFRAQGRSMVFRSPEALALLALAEGDPNELGRELHGNLAVLDKEMTYVYSAISFIIAAGLVTGDHRPEGLDALLGALLTTMVAVAEAE